jgi:hypothetical protein
MDAEFRFDFDFAGTSRDALLAAARPTVRGLPREFGDAPKAAPAAPSPADLLLDQLSRAVAEFSVYPDVFALNERHFEAHGLIVPARFKDLSREHRFYWLRFPITLKPAENTFFKKLKVAVEFNPEVIEGHLRPRAHTILPNRKFKQLMELSDSLEIRIGEDFDFEAKVAPPEVQVGGSKVDAEAKVDAKAAGKLGLIVGPFRYTWKKAELDHSPTGTEKVFWSIDGSQFFQEDEPTFVVVLQVPKTVKQVQIAAALQAYHHFNLAAAGLADAIRYLAQQAQNFFRSGAPVENKQVWDISPSL